MPTFDVLSGTWYHITAPDLETAQKCYDSYWGEDPMPEGCKVEEGEVDSHWIPVDLDGPELTFQEFEDILNEPEPPTGFEPRENAW